MASNFDGTLVPDVASNLDGTRVPDENVAASLPGEEIYFNILIERDAYRRKMREFVSDYKKLGDYYKKASERLEDLMKYDAFQTEKIKKLVDEGDATVHEEQQKPPPLALQEIAVSENNWIAWDC